MSHDNENPLIIDVVAEVEPPQSSEQPASKKADRPAGKRSFFKRGKSSASTATQAATEAEVEAAKRASAASSMPNVQGPSPQASAAQSETAQSGPQVQQVVSSPAEEPPRVQPQQPVQPAPQPQAQGPIRQEQVPVQPQQSVQQPATAGQPQQTRPPFQQPQSSQQQPPVQPAGAGSSQVPVGSQPQAAPQPVQPTAVPAPAAPLFRQGNMAAAAASPQRNGAVFVFGILAVLVVLSALVVVGLYAFLPRESQTLLAPTAQSRVESNEVRPVGSVSLDQASRVSLRATAEGWNEESSTPVIAYIKRVDDASSGQADKKESEEGTDEERYFAFAPNKNAFVSLPAGRYTFSFIAPMNADGSMYSVPDMVSMVVGDGGMAVLPIDFTRIPKEDITQEQVTRALAQLKTASEKGGESFDPEPFKKSIELALNTWFPQTDSTTEKPATDLTKEQQDALNAQADSQTSTENSESASSAPSTEHAHDWVAQHEQRWEPQIVPVIDTAAWESPVYARYRCQEGILFETLDACLAHVNARGNEPYAESNEIIRIDYHPAVVHYEEQGRYVDVITGYRCSICGATGTLN